MLTSLIQLRDVITEDFEIFFQHHLDQDTMRMADFPARDKNDFIARWNNILANPAIIKKTVVFDGKVAGNVMCFKQSGKRLVGYWIGKTYWSQHIATEALMNLLEQSNLRPLYACVTKHNISSIHVLEKCGFIICSRDDNEFMLELKERKTRSRSLALRRSLPTLTKSQIIESIHNNCGYSKTKSIKLTEIIFNIIKRTLESGEDILISGFGKFNVIDRHERKGRNPATGYKLTLRAKRIISFRCSSSLKKKINSNE